MATSLRAVYRHKPLESPQRQIRLLSVLPSRQGTQARYELTTYILGAHSTPHFYAISYEWGQAQPLHDILIDEQVFQIRSNLKDCLERFDSSYEGFHRPVWIDAICIDQSNVSERNEQVKVMGQIYASSMLVMAWFGKHALVNGNLTQTLSCLRDWQVSKEYRDLLAHDKEEHPGSRRLRSADTPQLMSLADPYGPMWNCLRHLCEKSYWTRLWIVQELVKAKRLLLVWGDEQIPWSDLAAAFRTIQLNDLYIRTSDSRFAPWDVIAQSVPYQVWLQRDGSEQQRALLDLMETYQASNCSVPHDKAYALTGISINAHLLPIDYDTSLPDLYVNLMQLLQHEQHCAKYSHLILGSLQLKPDDLLSRTSVTSLKGHKVDCQATLIGTVQAAKSMSIKLPSVNAQVEIYQLMLHASACLMPADIDGIDRWGQNIHQALRTRFSHVYEEICFFWLSSNQLGAALGPVPIDQAIYKLPGLPNLNGDLYFRVDNTEEDPGSTRSPAESPVLSSPSQSSSTFFSETSVELATRVWVSNVGTASGAEAVPPVPDQVIQIPLTDLVAADILLEVEFEPDSDVTPEPRRVRRGTRSDGPRRRSTRESASIPEVIDQAMSRPLDGKTSKLQKSSTWPTHVVSHVFIDALARQLRETLFTTETSSSLGVPD